jgi:Fe-S-cluster-containing dehydrogenase component/DMSO reductase anchor subunit
MLVEALVAREQTPVERFAGGGPARQRVPAAPPGTGSQYAFEVDLDACTGCKSCVAACQSLNGLDPGESWRTVGVLHGEGYRQTVTTGCHHCLEPGCLAGCPVDAYEKDPVTGIVVHLDDQCIGCRYCTLTCPYEVPRYNERLGIVRKCDMCHGRLAEGEAPACVQACPNGAIAITIVDRTERLASAVGAALVPSSPSSSITVPSTVYRSAREVPRRIRAGDSHVVAPAARHLPLAVMLVLTQLAVGALVADMAIGGGHRLAALVVGVLALGASVLHLGRPQYAWRAVIGLRHSWLSREVVSFGAFAGLATVDAVIAHPALDIGAALAGVGGVVCSVMVYATTHRRWWCTPATAARFGGTTAILGAATVVTRSASAALVVGALVAAKLAWETTWHGRRARARGAADDLGRTALLLARDLRAARQLRYALAGGGLLVTAIAAATGRPWLGAIAVTTLATGELVERSMFFTAVSPPTMPGAC